jgi:hypothetical protein
MAGGVGPGEKDGSPASEAEVQDEFLQEKLLSEQGIQRNP